MRSAHMIASGIPPAVIQAIQGSLATGISAAGTTVADATALTNDHNVVSTVAAGAGVVLPTGNAGDVIEVLNTGANPLNVYAPSTGQINGHTADVAAVLPIKTVGRFRYTSTVNVTAFLG